MKFFSYVLLLCAVLCTQCIGLNSEPGSALAWFTDATIQNGVRAAKPADALPEVPGTAGSGIVLARPYPVDNPLLVQENGLISFWIKPNWNGNDGKTHRILRIGDPSVNGLLVEKSDSGMLRYVMASPKKTTVSRADVSGWKAGEWHHIAIAWMSDNGVRIGTPLWIDKTCVDGPIASGNEFLNPKTMTDKRVWLGDETSDAVMDELIFRNWFDVYIQKENPKDRYSQIAIVHRDYFRTAPFTAIEIDHEPCLIASDSRVVNGCPKQFGLKAKFGSEMVRITDFTDGYGNWGDFDAKPYIKWSTSDSKIATVDADGMVTGKSVGRCILMAEFRGMKAAYDLQVIPIDQPDLDLLYVERLPRFSSKSEKWWPADGERVESVVHVGNYGYKPVPSGSVVKFDLILDANGNFRADADDKLISTAVQTIDKPLAPGERTSLTFPWDWTNDPVWVRVTLDPYENIDELCEANNQRTELNVARACRWGYKEKVLKQDYANRKINLVGSFSLYDWFNAHLDRLTLVMQDAVYPTTSPYGVKDAVRTDNFIPLSDAAPEAQEYEKVYEYYDGGFPIYDDPSGNLMVIAAGLIHELGHTCIALPDLYGYPVRADSVYLKDENGKLYAGTSMFPEIVGGGGSWLFGYYTLPLASIQGVPCGVGYDPLMSYCHMWLSPACAGQVQHFARYRSDNFWGVHGRLMPALKHVLKVYDINDKPLSGAAVYIYHTTQAPPDASAKYFPDVPKFIGNTDEEGRFVIPNETCDTWDDPETDEIDGKIYVWNPFGRVKTDTAFTSNVESLEGLLLIKIVSGDQTELHWLPQSTFNEAFFSGEKLQGTYTIRTSLASTGKVTPVVEPKAQKSNPGKNLRPIAVAPEEITVKCGQEFTIDGSKSSDPEGQPLIYRWRDAYHRTERARLNQTAIYKGKAPSEPGEYEYMLYVMDGIRMSEPAVIKVKVVK